MLEAGKHPNADKLQLCAVDVGEGEPRSIVCGAWNFGAGATVAVALPGAEIPGGLKIESRKLRGEVSDGMILSERELELGQDHSGIMVLGDGLEPGTPLADVLPLSEDVLEVEVTGNRPDLLAIYGLAREIAALYELELSPPPGREPELAGSEPVDVEIADLEGCPRFIGRLLRGVTIGPSPVWLQGAAHRRRDAADLERRRRDQLRDARPRQSAPRVRPRQAEERRPDPRQARRAGRGTAHARRHAAQARSRATS